MTVATVNWSSAHQLSVACGRTRIADGELFIEQMNKCRLRNAFEILLAITMSIVFSGKWSQNNVSKVLTFDMNNSCIAAKTQFT